MDGANDPNSKLGDFHYNSATKSAQDYAYNSSGDLNTDNNKGYRVVSYNYLHLPELIQVPGKGQIQYVYTAEGNKLRKIAWDSRRTRQVVDFVIGKRMKRTLKELIDRLLLSNPKIIRTDGLTLYQRLIPKDLHRSGAYCINHIERKNLSIRTHTAALDRY